MTARLPGPARRYFAFSIPEGTPLHTAVEITMEGEIGLGTKEAPGYRPMRARHLLAPPHGLVWQLRSGSIAGSDGALPKRSWTRFWLFGLLPIVRASGTDHQRSAFGRVIAEAAFWAPASCPISGTSTASACPRAWKAGISSAPQTTFRSSKPG